MPVEENVTYTCSRCGAQEILRIEPGTAGRRPVPPAWRRISIATIPTGDVRDRSDDLCRSCRSDLLRFLEGADLIPEEGLTIGPAILDGLPQEHVGYWDSAGALPLTALPVHRDDQIEFLKTHRSLYAITSQADGDARA